jgi:hypothetical protein
MKKYIRFFRNKEDNVTVNSYSILPKDKQTNDSIIDTPEVVYDNIKAWMNMYPNGKVDFVWLH